MHYLNFGKSKEFYGREFILKFTIFNFITVGILVYPSRNNGYGFFLYALYLTSIPRFFLLKESFFKFCSTLQFSKVSQIHHSIKSHKNPVYPYAYVALSTFLSSLITTSLLFVSVSLLLFCCSH